MLSWLSLEANAELAAAILAIVRAESARPTHVTQRTVAAVCGLPKRDYLKAARAKAFPTSKIGRLVIARTEDVGVWIDAHRAPEEDDEDAALRASIAAAGGRIVGRLGKPPKRR